MSAKEQMRAMLDQLMGSSRVGEQKGPRCHFTDSNVCKSFLLECCPHEILASTVSGSSAKVMKRVLRKMDLGDCAKMHDLALRADYRQAAASKHYYYELDALEHLKAFVADADRQTENAKKKLAATQEELSTEAAEKLARVNELGEEIGKKLAAAEEAGSQGNVEESLKYMEEVERIKKEKNAAEAEYRNSVPTSCYQQQKLRVCEVCSAYLGIQDNDRRLADHFGGKLHLGFISIREKLEELTALVEKNREEGVYEEMERERARERMAREQRYSSDRNRDRRSGDRDRGSRSRDYDNNHRDRDRSSRRSRSRDRDRHHGYSRNSHRDHHRDRYGSGGDRRGRGDRDHYRNGSSYDH